MALSLTVVISIMGQETLPHNIEGRVKGGENANCPTHFLVVVDNNTVKITTPVTIEFLVCASHYSNFITVINSFSLLNNPCIPVGKSS